jgi:hypothetical protein
VRKPCLSRIFLFALSLRSACFRGELALKVGTGAGKASPCSASLSVHLAINGTDLGLIGFRLDLLNDPLAQLIFLHEFS